MPPIARSVLAAAALAWAGTVAAEEGMWTYDNFPAAAVQQRYGVTIDQAWLDRVRAGTLRLSSGCSASIVSPEGLVMTNHHCVSDCVADLSTPQSDFLKTGFLTSRREEERACPGLQAERLDRITDVTGQVLDAVRGKDGDAFVTAHAAAISRIEAQGCPRTDEQRLCEVVSLYQGGRYALYEFTKFPDVRLAFAPEVQTAFFGGDPDNFNFPRYDLDVAFLRLYAKGAPVATPAHLRWSASAPSAGDPVFVPGNPGSTSRLMTAAQLEALRDSVLPQTLIQFSELRGRLIQFSATGEENARIASRELFTFENSLKVYTGQLSALNARGFLDRREAEERALKARIAADPALAARIGDPWGDLVKVQDDRRTLAARYSMLEQRGGYYSQLFAWARTLVRGAAERGKPNGERLTEFNDAKLPQTEKTLLEAKPAHPAVDEILLAFWLSKTRELLTTDAREVQGLLGRESPESLAAMLIRTRLGDARERRRLWDGGARAIAASDDPLIRFVRETDAHARAARREYEAKVTGPSAQAAEKIAQARFAVFGTSAYPDATFTPRVSYGAVEGWREGERTVPPFTTFAGLWERATGKPPYDLAPRWIAARARLRPGTVFNISTTNDIIGGNSGSPLINARAEVIGAVFDGNIHSLGGAFAYDPALNRTVSTSTASITEALETVYGQTALLKELLGL